MIYCVAAMHIYSYHLWFRFIEVAFRRYNGVSDALQNQTRNIRDNLTMIKSNVRGILQPFATVARQHVPARCSKLFIL